jgi:hypothetical protein
VDRCYSLALSTNETQEEQITSEIKEGNEEEEYGFSHCCASTCPLKGEITEICT